MAGYKGYSMSNNAVAAYKEGLKPFNKWTKREILAELTAQDVPAEIMEELRSWTLAQLRASFLTSQEWHHTSKYYNKTDFYSVIFDSEKYQWAKSVQAGELFYQEHAGQVFTVPGRGRCVALDRFLVEVLDETERLQQEHDERRAAVLERFPQLEKLVDNWEKSQSWNFYEKGKKGKEENGNIRVDCCNHIQEYDGAAWQDIGTLTVDEFNAVFFEAKRATYSIDEFIGA